MTTTGYSRPSETAQGLSTKTFWFGYVAWDCDCCKNHQSVQSSNSATEPDLRRWCSETRLQYQQKAGFVLRAIRRTYRLENGKPIADSQQDLPLDTVEVTTQGKDSGDRMRDVLARLRLGERASA